MLCATRRGTDSPNRQLGDGHGPRAAAAPAAAGDLGGQPHTPTAGAERLGRKLAAGGTEEEEGRGGKEEEAGGRPAMSRRRRLLLAARERGERDLS